MRKAFIFDMDGVIVDSERAWQPYEKAFLTDLFGQEIYGKIGNTVGANVSIIYDKARQYGFSMDKDEFFNRYDRQASLVYAQAAITDGLDVLAQKLDEYGFALGLVSSSRDLWIKMVLPKVPFHKQLQHILSLCDHPQLRPKPHPDGYIEAMKHLQSDPFTTIVLEDSNTGIQAAKSSGAFTIGFRQNLTDGYDQRGADVFAEDVYDVIKIAELFPSVKII